LSKLLHCQVQGLHSGLAKPDTDHAAKEFVKDRKHVREWCQCYNTLKRQTCGVLGKPCRLRCGQPLSVDLDHRVSGGSFCNGL